MRLETRNGFIKNKKPKPKRCFAKMALMVGGGNFYRTKKKRGNGIQSNNPTIQQSNIQTNMDRPHVHKNSERFMKTWLVIHAPSTKHK